MELLETGRLSGEVSTEASHLLGAGPHAVAEQMTRFRAHLAAEASRLEELHG